MKNDILISGAGMSEVDGRYKWNEDLSVFKHESAEFYQFAFVEGELTVQYIHNKPFMEAEEQPLYYLISDTPESSLNYGTAAGKMPGPFCIEWNQDLELAREIEDMSIGVLSLKKTLQNVLNERGVEVPEDLKLYAYPDLVKNIQGGGSGGETNFYKCASVGSAGGCSESDEEIRLFYNSDIGSWEFRGAGGGYYMELMGNRNPPVGSGFEFPDGEYGENLLSLEWGADGTSIIVSGATDHPQVNGTYALHEGSGTDSNSVWLKAPANAESSENTWSGYKYEKTTDENGTFYQLSEVLTEGLTYTDITPVAGKIYSEDALIRVDFIYEGNKWLFAEKFDGSFTHTFTQLGEDPVFAEVDGRKCMLLDTSHTFSYPSDGLPSGSSARTITAWIYPKNDNANGFYVFYGKHSPENSPAYMLGIHSYYNDFNIMYANAFVFSKNQWYHITLTYENGQAKLYVNGVLKKTVDRELSTVTDNAEYPLTLGWLRADAYWDTRTNGYISDLQIYGYALTEAEIQSLANA